MVGLRDSYYFAHFFAYNIMRVSSLFSGAGALDLGLEKVCCCKALGLCLHTDRSSSGSYVRAREMSVKGSYEGI